MSDNAGYEMTLRVGGNVVAYAVNVRLDGDKTVLDDSVRGHNGFRSRRGGLIGFTVDCDHLYYPTNAAFQALLASFLNDSNIALQLRDPDGWGWNGDARCFRYSQDEPLDGVVMAPFGLESRGEWTRVTGTS